jgi:hypothetical protein
MVLMYLVLGGIVTWLLLRDDEEILEETITNDYEGWVIEEEKESKNENLKMENVHKKVKNDYEGWVIEETKVGDAIKPTEFKEEKIKNSKDPLPFR